MTRYGIYTGKRLSKDDHEVEYITNISFFMDDVLVWEEYPDSVHYKNNSPKVFIELPKCAYILVEEFSRFDAAMKNHHATKVSHYKN